MDKSLYKQIMELEEGVSLKYSSDTAKKLSNDALKQMSGVLRKASANIIRIMNSDIKSKKYDPMDLQRTLKQGSIRDAHGYERDFIQSLWIKVRDGFRRYSKTGKLR